MHRLSIRVPSFRNRREAGRLLGAALLEREIGRPFVVALPRGGVPVAYEVAAALHAPLDVCVVKKLGLPWHPELGLGAVAEGGHIYVDRTLVRDVGLGEFELQGIVRSKQREVDRRVQLYRSGLSRPKLQGQSAILVDDGIATGGTIRAAVASLRESGPAKVILAVPVAAAQALRELQPLVDEVVCLQATGQLKAVSYWYEDFTQVDDREVVQLLYRAGQCEEVGHAHV